MKVKFWTFVENSGDGSVYVRFFPTKKSAQDYASKDNERFCDDICEEELEFDDQGNLLTPVPKHWSE